MSELNTREKRLVSLGAAIASNCIPCIEFHVPAARRDGLSDCQIREAVRIADLVRKVPARAVLESALTNIESEPGQQSLDTIESCGCSGPNPGADAGFVDQ